jgi:peroxidase
LIFFFNKKGGVDPILRGLFTMPAKVKRPTQNLNSELTEHLFTTAHAVSLDLAAMNIQRGRDHALGTYMQYRKLCNLTTSSTFEGLEDISDASVKQKLKELYGNPDNIDLWVGGILEDQVTGARVGPLFRCIIIDQFRRLRDGDRFWFENPGVFKPEQLAQIKQTSLARVLCDNGDNITRVTEDIFTLPSLQGGYKNCTEIPMISLRSAWTDCSDCSGHRSAYNLDITKLPNTRRFRRDVKAIDEDGDAENRIDKDYIDMNEQRTEGLETLIESFTKTLKKMKREIREMKHLNAELLKSVNMTHNDDDSKVFTPSQPKQHQQHFQCVDRKGINRLNNEIWMEDDCTNCLCQHHQITCTIEKCPDITPKCENGLVLGKKHGQCCPTCIDQKFVANNDNKDDDETTITSNVTSSR